MKDPGMKSWYRLVVLAATVTATAVFCITALALLALETSHAGAWAPCSRAGVCSSMHRLLYNYSTLHMHAWDVVKQLQVLLCMMESTSALLTALAFGIYA